MLSPEYRLTLEPERAVALRKRECNIKQKVLQSLEPRAENCALAFKGGIQAWESLTTVESLRAGRSAATC